MPVSILCTRIKCNLVVMYMECAKNNELAGRRFINNNEPLSN
jgi:hypothetical protein